MNKNLLLAVLSGVLFSVAWPTNGFPLFLFFSFVPLLLIEEDFYRNKHKKRFFLYVYLAFFIWNLSKTWWILNSTIVGGVFAIVVNSLLMAFAFWLFHFVRKRLSIQMAFPFFVAIWISFEKFHLNWDFSWPWLNLGNGFSSVPSWVQWYEYTGYFGGALWILIGNLIVYKGVSAFMINHHRNTFYKTLFNISLWIVLPMIFSWWLGNNYEEKGKNASVLILQPNLDPWEEKFHYTNSQLVDNLLALVKDSTDLIVAPETAISQYVEIRNFNYTTSYKKMLNFSKLHHTAILTGVDFIHWYPKTGAQIPDTANKTVSGRWFDMYNSAVMFDGERPLQIYHKSKLVVGAEYTPFKNVLVPLIGDWVTKTIGVSMGSNVSQKDRGVFVSGKMKVAPIICYESIYAQYVTDYVKNKANLLAVITNDGWWGNTQGHKQHLSMARLRAIENRRDVVQSANTGISAHIDQKGNIIQSLAYNKRGRILADVRLNESKTFYTQQGDYIARVAIFMAILLFLYSFAHKKIRL